MSAALEAALAYAAHGWPVLPPLCLPDHRCVHPGKLPHRVGWQLLATTDADVITTWWRRENKDGNVGLLTGPGSGLAVVDVDPRNGGVESLAVLEVRVGVLPGTVQSLTGGGGLHMLYAHPGHKVTSRSASLGRGLDVKGDGGFIVAPPSRHASGRCYGWLGGVWDVELTPWPEVLTPPAVAPVHAFERPAGSLSPAGKGHPARRLEGLVQTVMDAVEGERNSRLFWAACRGAEMVAGGVDGQVVTEALLLAAQAVGLSVVEASATVRSGLRSGTVAA